MAEKETGGGNRRHKRSWRNFLLDPGFQLKYTLLIVLAGGLVFGSMEALFYDQVRENSELAELDGEAEFAAELRAELEAEDRKVLMQLAGFWLALVLALFLIGVLATHRIVGPIYVVDLYVQRIRDGLPVVTNRKLRRGDEFQHLYNHVNEMAIALKDERLHDVDAIERALSALRARRDALPEGDAARAVLDDAEADLTPLTELIELKRTYIDSAR
jgi:hypothetical protein